jgi:hypothetical protein
VEKQNTSYTLCPFAPFIVFLVASCAHSVAGINESPPTRAYPYPEKPPAIVEESIREDQLLFEGLPAGISGYLLDIAAAFAAHDEGFLLDQGEDAYEKTVRNRVDDEQYLAMLYRTGAYADDAVWNSPFTVDIGRVIYVDYGAWKESGPVLEVDGKIQMKSGRPLVFSLKVLWRLDRPKLLGVFP